MRNDRHPSSLLLDVRAATSTYVKFGVIFGSLFVGSLFVRDTSPKLLCGAVLILALIWIRSFRIAFDGSDISYSTLVGRTRSIALDSISSARTEIGGGGPFDPMFRLVLAGSENRCDTPIIINTKVFRRDDLQKLFAILGPKMIGRPRLDIFEKRKSTQ